MKLLIYFFTLALFAIPIFGKKPSNDLEMDLIAHYSLNGNALDESGNGHDALAVGAFSYEQGIEGLAAKFENANFFNCGTLFSVGTGEISVSMWVNFGQDDGDNQFFTNGLQVGDPHLIALTYSNSGTKKIRAVVQDSMAQNVYTPSTYPLNEWFHVLFTRNEAQFQLFINGVLVNSSTISTGSLGHSEDWFLGRGHQNNGFFNGLIDEVRIYNRALNNSEIQLLSEPRESMVTLQAVADSFIESGQPNVNEGGNHLLLIRASENNHAFVAFDRSQLVEGCLNDLNRATLVLSIYEQASNNWGEGREVIVHRMLEPWKEGNGFNSLIGLGGCADRFIGDGSGVTWNCNEDPDVGNQNSDGCDLWNGAWNSFANATAEPVIHTSGQTGVVTWDVTQDVFQGAFEFGWIVKNLFGCQSGNIKYYSREGALAEGNINLAPRLILEFD